jgi:Fe-S oxidoreductase
MSLATPDRETLDILLDLGAEKLKMCYQCGTCTGTCPWNMVKSFIVRKLMHQAQLGMVDFENEDIWTCATCNACVKRCPRGVEIIDVMKAMRRVIAEIGAGKVPDSLRLSMKNIAYVGNPQGEAAEKRAEWSQSKDIKPFTSETEWLYFPCCIPSYDTKVRRIALSTVDILKTAGVDFGILGEKEKCCGESVRKSGNEETFQSTAGSNIAAFAESGVKNVLVSSPHCYHTFKNEYPALGAEFEAVHTVQFLAQLLKDQKLKFSGEVKKKVIYHDPCYLGRHNDIYDEPRQVLEAIPGLELIEFPDSKKEAICCGGGGGRIWMDTKKGERLCDIRLQQAIDMGADVLAVACPYCMLNFDDSQLSMEKEGIIEIKDITELVTEAI